MKPKRGVGRPAKYLPEYCDKVVEFCSQGYSLTAFAGSIRVSRETIYEWGRNYAEFADSLKKAKAARVARLEEGLLTERNPIAWIFALKNACPDEWKDVQKIEHKDVTGEDFENMTREELRRLLALVPGVQLAPVRN